MESARRGGEGYLRRFTTVRAVNGEFRSGRNGKQKLCLN